MKKIHQWNITNPKGKVNENIIIISRVNWDSTPNLIGILVFVENDGKELFDRLPREVIVYIFDKIIDAKCLSVCCSVSKLFAALALQTRFISVQIRGAGYRSYSWSQESLNFLKKFSCVESVIIQFLFPLKLRRSVSLIGYKSDSSSFILVSAKCHIDETTGMFEATSESELRYCDALVLPIIRHMLYFRRRFAYTEVLVDLFPNLKNIWAVESTEHGSVVWEEDIARRTKEKLLKDLCVKVWTAPSVKLPRSGCVMQDAILISIQEIEACHEMISFEEEEHRELAATMMKKFPCKETSCMLHRYGVRLVGASGVTSLVIHFVQSLSFD